MMADVPFIGYSNETLSRLPKVEPGQEFLCPRCGQWHALYPPSDGARVLLYRCRGHSSIGAVDGRLVVHITPDVSSTDHTRVHNICDSCYLREEPNRQPRRIPHPHEEVCCFCENETLSGIYYLASLDRVRCGGTH